MYRDSMVYDFFFEFIPAMFAVTFGIAVALFAIAVVGFYTLDRPACAAKGEKTGLETYWSFRTGCMVSLGGQWVDEDDVIPVERNGKIVFAPKPVFKIEGQAK